MASSGLKDNITAISLWNSCCCFCSSKWCTSSTWTASCKNATAMKNASKMIFLGATLALLLAGFPASALPNSRTSEPWRQSRTLTSLRTSPRLLQLPFALFFLFPLSQSFLTQMAHPFIGPGPQSKVTKQQYISRKRNLMVSREP